MSALPPEFGKVCRCAGVAEGEMSAKLRRTMLPRTNKDDDGVVYLFIGTHSVTTTLNVHSRSRSFVIAIDLRGLAPSMRLFRRPNTNGMKK